MTLSVTVLLSRLCALLYRTLSRSPGLYEQLRGCCTSHGITLDRCIRPGVEASDTGTSIGLLAGDAECYTLFMQVFAPVLSVVHRSPFPRHRRHHLVSANKIRLLESKILPCRPLPLVWLIANDEAPLTLPRYTVAETLTTLS